MDAIFVSAEIGAEAIACAVPLQPWQRSLPGVCCALTGTGGLMPQWEGLRRSLNSPGCYMKVGFLQVEKVSFQIQFYWKAGVISLSLPLTLRLVGCSTRL